MVTQLLFGEHFTILEKNDVWIRIKNAFDGYEGWINEKQYLSITKKSFNSIQKSTPVYAADLQEALSIKKDQNVFPILMGSALPGAERGSFQLEGKDYKYHGKTVDADVKPSRSKLIKTAALFLHAPYLWGGKSEFGIDCSGFTQTVFKVNGIKLPRDAYQQAEEGKTLNFVEEALPGDLAFFDNEKGKITHVGILIDHKTIIHASGFVRIDKFDLKGIFSAEKKEYTHKLRAIKRLPFDL
jgi:gamma-D-glutamyl-L-lysine dipeptidyl-peptidase